jgi:AraC-like DNA-binding protein
MKKSAQTNSPSVKDLAWLGSVREARLPISFSRPLWGRVVRFDKGSGSLPRPGVQFPEQHPHCELNMVLAGTCTQYVNSEKVSRRPKDVMLLGPATPHYPILESLPQESVSVYFSPVLLLEIAPKRDGARALARFTMPSRIEDRVVRVKASVADKMASLLVELVAELHSERAWSEFRTRSLLLDVLLEFFRWEDSVGREYQLREHDVNWSIIQQTLDYMHQNFAEPIYVRDLARAVGLSLSRLQSMFRSALGMSCIQYLRAYRISQAASMLCMPDARVTEVAFNVGFETLSHFNTSFHALMGMAPTRYADGIRRGRKHALPPKKKR